MSKWRINPRWRGKKKRLSWKKNSWKSKMKDYFNMKDDIFQKKNQNGWKCENKKLRHLVLSRHFDVYNRNIVFIFIILCYSHLAEFRSHLKESSCRNHHLESGSHLVESSRYLANLEIISKLLLDESSSLLDESSINLSNYKNFHNTSSPTVI
jgi:hypothetical protein